MLMEIKHKNYNNEYVNSDKVNNEPDNWHHVILFLVPWLLFKPLVLYRVTCKLQHVLQRGVDRTLRVVSSN